MTGNEDKEDQDSPNLYPEMSPGRLDAAATGEYTPRQCLVYGPTQDGPGSSTKVTSVFDDRFNKH